MTDDKIPPSPQDKPSPQDQHQRLQEKILSDYPRLGPDDKFKFSCHPGISCFNNCCGDVNIFLSPYDVLRLKKRLGMTSTEFLEKYTLMPVHKDMKTPTIVLRMGDDGAKSCPFLAENGCSVYNDRPWPCRMYPLGMASSKDTPDGWQGERFYFLLEEGGCMGFEEEKEYSVREWLDDQGVDEYDEWGEGYKELTLHKFFQDGGTLVPERMHMLFTACYDLDKFREFVFGSSLLDRFIVDEDFVDSMRYDDDELLRFAFLWMRFSLFGEPTVKMRAEAVDKVMGTGDPKLADKIQKAKQPPEQSNEESK